MFSKRIVKGINVGRSNCKQCDSNMRKLYYVDNKNKVDKKNRNWYEVNKEKRLIQCKEYNKNNKAKRQILSKDYFQKNKALIYKQRIKRSIERKKVDVLYKLKCSIRNLIYNSITRRGFKKNSRTQSILGCSFKQFKKHIENQFEAWMNWDNYGKYTINGTRTWNLDHKTPSDVAVTEVEIIKINHYTNLRPLDSFDNILKSNSIIQEN